MFEELEKEEREQKQERKKLIQMTAYIVGALVVVIAIIYLVTARHAKTPQAAKAPTAAPRTPPNAARDLQLVHARMGKDPTGTSVMWSVHVRNRSAVYTYSDIEYEGSLVALDGRTLATVRGTIKDSIGPGEEKKFPEFVNGIYDARASTYMFVITGATASPK